MKNLQDIAARMQNEMIATKKARFQADEDFYVYYQETTEEHDGGFLILRDAPANPDFRWIAMRMRRDQTDEQNLYQFMQIARKLPILSLERGV